MEKRGSCFVPKMVLQQGPNTCQKEATALLPAKYGFFLYLMSRRYTKISKVFGRRILHTQASLAPALHVFKRLDNVILFIKTSSQFDAPKF